MAALLLCLAALACMSQLSLSAPSSTEVPLINSWNLGADQKARNPDIVALRKAVSSALGLGKDAEGNATTRLKPWGAAAAAAASDLSADDVGEQKFIGANHPFGRLLQQVLRLIGLNPNINLNNPFVVNTALGGTAPGSNDVLNPSFIGNGGFLFPFSRGRDASAKTAGTEGAKQNDTKSRVPGNRRPEANKDNVKRQNNRMKLKQQQQIKVQQQQLQNSNQGGELFQDDEDSKNNHKQLHYYKFVVSQDSADDRKVAEEKEDSEK